MYPKAHGTSAVPVQDNLRWGCDRKKADEICNFNRHYAEHSGYFEKTKFKEEARKASGKVFVSIQTDFDILLTFSLKAKGPLEFYDSNTGKLLFTAPGMYLKWIKYLVHITYFFKKKTHSLPISWTHYG